MQAEKIIALLLGDADNRLEYPCLSLANVKSVKFRDINTRPRQGFEVVKRFILSSGVYVGLTPCHGGAPYLHPSYQGICSGCLFAGWIHISLHHAGSVWFDCLRLRPLFFGEGAGGGKLAASIKVEDNIIGISRGLRGWFSACKTRKAWHRVESYFFFF